MRAEVLVEALRERRRTLAWWSLGVIALVAINVAFYPSIRGDTALNDYVKNLPDSVRGLFVGGELDITSPAGYLNSQIYAVMAPIVLLIFAIGAGAGAVAGEEERGTLDFLLANPLRRRDYVVQRFLALTALVAALAGVLLATVWLTSLLVDLEIGLDRLAAASLSVGLLALFFGTVALAAGSLRYWARRGDRRRRRRRDRLVAPRRAWAGRGRARALAPALAVLPADRQEPASGGRSLVGARASSRRPRCCSSPSPPSGWSAVTCGSRFGT